jgi:hypothetical protein
MHGQQNIKIWIFSSGFLKILKVHENPSTGSQVFPFGRADGRRDVRKPTVALRNFAHAPTRTPWKLHGLCFLVCLANCCNTNSSRHMLTLCISLLHSSLLLPLIIAPDPQNLEPPTRASLSPIMLHCCWMGYKVCSGLVVDKYGYIPCLDCGSEV